MFSLPKPEASGQGTGQKKGQIASLRGPTLPSPVKERRIVHAGKLNLDSVMSGSQSGFRRLKAHSSALRLRVPRGRTDESCGVKSTDRRPP